MTREELEAAGYTRLCALAEVPSVMPKKVSAKGRALLVCRTTDGASVVDELCPHKMESMAFGLVHEDRIICPHHQYTFDLETGRSSMRRCPPLQVYETRLSDGEEIYAMLPSG